MSALWRCSLGGITLCLGGFALLAGLCFGDEKALREPVRDPVLGRPELIGSLLIVKVSGEDTSESAAPAPIPMLDSDAKLLPAASELPSKLATTSSRTDSKATLAPSDPAQIAFHLGQAITGMMEVGLADDAKEVGSILTRFQNQHHVRLLLIQKQTELAELQAEIERLKARVEKGVSANQISMSFKIVEIPNTAIAKRLGLTSHHGGKNSKESDTSFSQSVLRGAALGRELKRLENSKEIRVLASPKIVVTDGATAVYDDGREIRSEVIKKVSNSDAPRRIGHHIEARPEIVGHDTVRLQLKIEQSVINSEKSVSSDGESIPAISRHAFSTYVDAKGDELMLAKISGAASNDGSETTTCVVIQLEILEPRIPVTGAVK